MATTVYRFRLASLSLSQIKLTVPGAPTVGTLSPAQFLDITIDSAYLADLTDCMVSQGFTYDSTNPTISAALQTNATPGTASPWTGVSRSVRAASTADVALSGLQVLDGVVLVAGDRFLCKNQGTPSQNGVYVVQNSTWTLANDWFTGSVVPEMVINVSEGTTQAHTDWNLTTQGAIVVGTTALTFSPVSALASGAAAGGDLTGTLPNPTLVQSVRLNAGGLRLVRLASTANVASISGLLTIDGVVTVAGNRVLLKNQTTASQNGVYVVAAGAWSYAPDWVTGLVTGEIEFGVSEGTANAHTDWSLTTQGAITVGTTAVAITQVSASVSGAAGGVLAGNYPNPTFASAYAASSVNPVNIGPSQAAPGSSNNYARADHAHAIDSTYAASSVTPASIGPPGGLVGSSTNYARADHLHPVDPNYQASSATPATLGAAGGVTGSSTKYSREDHAHPLNFGTAAGTITQGNDSRLSDTRTPGGAAGGDLTGTYPNPTLAAGVKLTGSPAGGILSGTYPNPGFASGYGPSSTTPVAVAVSATAGSLSTYARADHAHALDPAFQAASVAPTNVGVTSTQGGSTNYARADHSHSLDPNFQASAATPTTVSVVGAVGSSTKYAREDHSHSLAAAYQASSVTPATVGTGAVGSSTNYARADHSHAITFGTVANTAAQGNDSRLSDARAPTGAAGGPDLTGTYPNPTLIYGVVETTGGASTDIVVKTGTTLADGSVNAAAHLHSFRTGIGGTEVEKAYIDGAGILRSGATWFVAGVSASANVSGATAVGGTAVASAAGAVALGNGSNAGFSNSIALGTNSKTSRVGELIKSIDAAATMQRDWGMLAWYCQTTAASAVEMFLDGSSARAVLADQSVFQFYLQVIGKISGSVAGLYSKNFRGLIYRGAGAATTVLSALTSDTAITVGTLSSAAIAVTADTSNGSLKITCSGVSGSTVNWVASAHITELRI